LKLALLLAPAFASITIAAPLNFYGEFSTSGPPFPSLSLLFPVTAAGSSPIQFLSIPLTGASSGGLAIHASADGPLIHIEHSNLETYDFPGSYSQRFDGIDPSGERSHSSVLGQVFNDRSFEALIQVDLSPNAPEDHLYYTIQGHINPNQPVTFAAVNVIPSPEGFFDLNIDLTSTGGIFDHTQSVIEMDLSGNTLIPEPASFSALVLLAASRHSRYHRRSHG